MEIKSSPVLKYRRDGFIHANIETNPEMLRRSLSVLMHTGLSQKLKNKHVWMIHICY